MLISFVRSLALIALVLITGGHYLDIAVRDIVMAIAAFVLAKMTSILNAEQASTAGGV